MREREVETKANETNKKKFMHKIKKVLNVLFSKTSEEDKNVSDKEKMKALIDVAIATEELKQLKKEVGLCDTPRKENRNRETILINKKKYIWLAVLTGWFGGHRFYIKHYKVGLLYLLFSWAGIGLYHSMVDIMIVLPMKADENGDILV